MTAPQPLPLAELSPAEQARIEEVARALHDDDCDCEEWPCLDGWDRKYRRLAAAAIAVMPASPAEEALRRVEALCDVADDQPDGYECRFIATDVIRAAIAAPQTGEHTTGEEADRG